MEQVLRRPEVATLAARYGREALLRELRGLLAEVRAHAGADAAGLEEALAGLAAALERRLAEAARPTLEPVINATGVVIHTNLGRAPLPAAAAQRAAAVAAAYSSLELDLAGGGRGEREAHAGARLRRLLGAEAALAVNNNAAAVLLAVNSLAEGREVLVSRGELVEIGGSFRIPDVLRKGGATLREVGTTNRTRIADFRNGLSPRTAMILKVHPSNFRIVGFTEAVPLPALVELARAARIPLVEDLGSGLIEPVPGLEHEPRAARSLELGVDLATFSGDKLLGGPQAGLIVGRGVLVDALRRNPLYRALRLDKMTLAALDAVLALHEAGRAAFEIPVLRMLRETPDAVRERAAALAGWLRAEAPSLEVEVRDGSSAVGGGAAPAVEIPTALVCLRHPACDASRLAARLRAGSPPVLARIEDERLLVDMRTVLPGEEPALQRALRGLEQAR